MSDIGGTKNEGKVMMIWRKGQLGPESFPILQFCTGASLVHSTPDPLLTIQDCHGAGVLVNLFHVAFSPEVNWCCSSNIVAAGLQ